MKAEHINNLFTIIQIALIFWFFCWQGVTIYLILVTLAYWFQDRIIYIRRVPRWVISPQDNPKLVKRPEDIGLQYQKMEIRTKDGVLLRGWLVSRPNSKRIIVYFHGNMALLWWRVPLLKFLHEQTDSDILMVAYRGFSDSEGWASEEGLKIDAHAIMDQAIKYRVRELQEGRQKDLFVYGRSLGGAVSIYLASSTKYKTVIKGIVLENTFTSLHELFINKLRLFPFLGLVGVKQWNSKALIDQIEHPIMFTRSLKDHLIHPVHMKTLRESASKSKVKVDYEVETGKHQPIWYLNPGKYASALNSFFQQAQTLATPV